MPQEESVKTLTKQSAYTIQSASTNSSIARKIASNLAFVISPHDASSMTKHILKFGSVVINFGHPRAIVRSSAYTTRPTSTKHNTNAT